MLYLNFTSGIPIGALDDNMKEFLLNTSRKDLYNCISAEMHRQKKAPIVVPIEPLDDTDIPPMLPKPLAKSVVAAAAAEADAIKKYGKPLNCKWRCNKPGCPYSNRSIKWLERHIEEHPVKDERKRLNAIEGLAFQERLGNRMWLCPC